MKKFLLLLCISLPVMLGAQQLADTAYDEASENYRLLLNIIHWLDGKLD